MASFQNEREQLAELETLIRAKRYDEANALGSSLIELFPDSFLIRLHYAKALKESKFLLRAESVLAALAQRYGDNITFLTERVDLLRRMIRFDEAELDLKKILFLDPFNSKAKSALDELKRERLSTGEKHFEVVDYSSKSYLEDQTVPEVILKTAQENSNESFEPVLDMDEEPDSDYFFNPTQATHSDVPHTELELDLAEPSPVWPSSAALESDPEPEEQSYELPEVESKEWVHIDLSSQKGVSPNPSIKLPENPIRVETCSNHEMGFITESAARLYAKQGLYHEALAIYEKLNHLSQENKFSDAVSKIKHILSSEKQIEYLNHFLNHFTTDRGSYFV